MVREGNWRKASYSNGSGSCVEAGNAAGNVAVRDTKDRDRAVLAFTPRAWREFAARVKASGLTRATRRPRRALPAGAARDARPAPGPHPQVMGKSWSLATATADTGQRAHSQSTVSVFDLTEFRCLPHAEQALRQNSQTTA